MRTSKRPKQTARAPLPDRLAALEERVSALEKELAALRPPPKEPPRPPKRTGPRCPGCSLPVTTVARGTCPWCGFVFEAVCAAKRRRRL